MSRWCLQVRAKCPFGVRCVELSASRQLRFFVASTSESEIVPKDLPLDGEVFGKILDRNPDIRTLKKLHSNIFRDQVLRADPVLGVKLMRAYAARGKPETARQVFDEVCERNVIIYNVMIRSYVNNRQYRDALVLFKDMLGCGYVPDNYTYPCVLKACSGSSNKVAGLQIHAAAVRVGQDSCLFVGNGLVAMYGKCGCLAEARQVLDEMPRRDVVSWNSMVACYAQNGQFDSALRVCREMELLKVGYNSGTMASLLPAVSNASAESVEYVEKMFLKMDKSNLISWNVMIAVYVNNSMPAKAVDLFSQMEAHKVEPDVITFASILPACGDLSALSLGRKIHECVERKKLRPNLLLENALIDMYAKCGCLSDARQVFDKLIVRDVISWTSMISAYGISGLGRDAVALFSRMQNSGLEPDSIAFVSVLSACSHTGLLDKGRHYFNLMIEEHGIEPRLEHFSCMVDLLGRAGKVDEAYRLIQKMPIEPNERVWGALLGACRVYSNMKIGLLAADCLFQLVPEQSGYYVLLSNIYAKAGRWQDVAKVRSTMKSKGIKKAPGVSNFELNNIVHTFLAGDQSHPQSTRIYEELDILVGKMRGLGYVPETDSTLHDVEDEDKDGHLAVHSEKLAIVFALLNTEPGTPIRITKNLRICGDCHTASRLISKITQREIIIRDTNRFHNFVDGVCSCGDYW